MTSSSLAADRLRCLQRVSLELTAAVSIDEVITTVIDVLDAPIAAPSRSVWLRAVGDDELVLAGHRGMAAAAVDQFQRIALSAEVPGAVAARERRTIVSVAPADAVGRFAVLRDVPRSTTGFVAIPLLGEDICVGVLGIGINEDLDDEDLSLFEAVAAQVAQTIVRVRLTERDRRRRTELEFLANLTDTALQAVDHVELMRRACAEAVPTLGDYCSLHFLPESGGPPLVAATHIDPVKAAFVEDLQARYPYDADRKVGVPAVIRSGMRQFIPRLTTQIVDAALASLELSADEAIPILEQLAITSAMTIPLRTKRRVVGAMQLVSAESGRHYDEDDLALAEAVAGRLAEALDAAWVADQQRSIAATLQRALLPPALPLIGGLDIAARYWPAGINPVGGDFYDVFPIAEHEWALVIGDVCGTGTDAAALTSIARHTVRAAARHGVDAGDVMAWLNEAVVHSNRNMYCTACYATLRADNGGWHFTSTAAGHPLPIIATASGPSTVGAPGTLLGAFAEITTTTAAAQPRVGDVIVLYTDGITDLPRRTACCPTIWRRSSTSCANSRPPKPSRKPSTNRCSTGCLTATDATTSHSSSSESPDRIRHRRPGTTGAGVTPGSLRVTGILSSRDAILGPRKI
jgi:serine phosphatase RsbU (regulator of sigma subunit)